MRYILNQIKTPDGTILTSYHVHDYKTHIDKNGEEYMIDGGTYYLKRSINTIPYQEQSIEYIEPFEVVRRNLHWGTYGKQGDKPLTYITINKMTEEHIESILKIPEDKLDPMYRKFFIEELQYRIKGRNK